MLATIARLRCAARCALLAALALAGCPADDPRPTGDAAPPDRALADGRTDSGDGDAAACTPSWPLPPVSWAADDCPPRVDDYAPGRDDAWPACIADDGQYHPFDASISSAARAAAAEAILARLLRDAAPTPTDFTAARLDYTQPEGLDSRVSRREDEHYPAPDKPCAEMTASEVAANAARCVGQAQLQPLLNAAFQDGSRGAGPLRSAARVEAALLWFLYVSVHKEATTCSERQKDCDSAYAYYTAGEPRSGGKGLARYVRALSARAHERIWDGLLAVRCWRDLDAAEPAADPVRRDRAIAQLDRALLHGLALITASRVAAAEATCGEPQQALWQSAQILGGVLGRAAALRDALRARLLRDELAKPFAAADRGAIDDALAALFRCP